MPDFTKQNLRDLEDMAPKFGLEATGEARFARTALDGGHTGMSLQRLRPEARQTFGHRHGEQEEIYVILEGGGRLKLDDELVDVEPWDAIRVGPETTRCFEAGPEGLELLAFSGGTTSADAEMIPGWWSD